MKTAREFSTDEARMIMTASLSQFWDEVETNGYTPKARRKFRFIMETWADFYAFFELYECRCQIVETLDYAAGWDVRPPDGMSHNI